MKGFYFLLNEGSNCRKELQKTGVKNLSRERERDTTPSKLIN